MGYNQRTLSKKEIERRELEKKLFDEKITKEIEAFLNIGDGRRLVNAYNFLNERKISYRLYDDLIEIGEKKNMKLVNEFKNEYEVKLKIDYSGDVKNPETLIGTSPEEFMRGIMNKVNFFPNFIPGTEIMQRNSLNHFYGKGKKEGLVIMEGDETTSLKRKIKLPPLDLGINNEEFVIVREESIKRNVSDEEVYSAIEKAVLNGERRIGKVSRERARVDFISSVTGRIYEVVFDKCYVYKENSSGRDIKRQLEIEYQGKLIKANSQPEKNLREMVSELISFGNLFSNNLRGLEIDEGIINSANFTTERKYDWLIQ